MEFTTPFQQEIESLKHENNSQFLVVDSDDVQKIEALSAMFPKLSTMIKNNQDKNLVLNFREGRQRSLIVMVVSKSATEVSVAC